jgi:hypothetical protein
VQWFSGSWPAGTDVHVPGEPVSAHDAQFAVHAVVQQTPCAQKVELHWAPIVHAAPIGSLPQLPLTQLFGETQSAAMVATVHVVLHAVALAHWYGSQSELVTVRQAPAPSQVRAGVSVEPVQLPGTHSVPAAQYRHAPAPLQTPSSPQLVDRVPTHWLAMTGAVPFGTFEQVPTRPDNAHDLHVPLHAVSQQRPCAQKPELHSAAAVHVAPIGLSEHVVPLQMFGDTQCVSAEQLVRHTPVVASHWNAPHGCVVAAAQAPAPSHSCAGL